MNIPIIRLEVEGLKRSVIAALSDHAVQMDSDIIAAVESYCKPENISRIVHDAAKAEIDRVITEEVKAFFSKGPGRSAVAAAVQSILSDSDVYTPGDSSK